MAAGPVWQFTTAGVDHFEWSFVPEWQIAGRPFAATVTAKDAFGNTAVGYTGTVHFTSNDGQAVLPANYTFVAGDNGLHSFSATLKTAGTRSITATDTVTSSITGTQSGLHDGADASVQIIYRQVRNVLTVPSAAVHLAADGSSYVYVDDNGTKVKTTVKTTDTNPAQAKSPAP